MYRNQNVVTCDACDARVYEKPVTWMHDGRLHIYCCDDCMTVDRHAYIRRDLAQPRFNFDVLAG